MIKFTPPNFPLNALPHAASYEALNTHVNVLHKGYVDRLNARFSGSSILQIPPSQVLSDIGSFFRNRSEAQFYIDNMGGAFAHTLFWQVLDPNRPYENTPELRDLSSQIQEAANGFIGSGWVWVYLNRAGSIEVSAFENHDTPFMRKQTPIFCIDLWEHAYFYDMLAARTKWLEEITCYLDLRKINEILSDLSYGSLSHPIDNLLIN